MGHEISSTIQLTTCSSTISITSNWNWFFVSFTVKKDIGLNPNPISNLNCVSAYFLNKKKYILHCPILQSCNSECYNLNHWEDIYAEGKTGLKMTCDCWLLILQVSLPICSSVSITLWRMDLPIDICPLNWRSKGNQEFPRLVDLVLISMDNVASHAGTLADTNLSKKKIHVFYINRILVHEIWQYSKNVG